MLGRVYLCYSLVCLVVLPSYAYTIKYTTSPDSFPAPGDNITFTVLKDDGDVSPIDVILVNTAGDGNITTVIESLSPDRNTNLIVDVPNDEPPGQYLLRFVDHSTKKFILDSATFQIYAAGTTHSASSSSTSSVATTAPTSSNTSLSKHKKSNIGPIVGGVVGGVGVLAFISLFLLCMRKRKRRRTGEQDLANEKALPRSSTSTQHERIEPFTIAPRPRLPQDVSTPYSNDTSNSTSGAVSSNIGLNSGAIGGQGSSGKGGYTWHVAGRPSTTTVESSSGSITSPLSSTSPSSRVGRTNYEAPAPLDSTARTPVEGSRENELSAQIMRLQEQVRQIEARQALGSGGGEDFLVPPPMYDGLLPAPASVPVPRVNNDDGGRETPTTNSSVDVKVPLQ